MFVQKSQNDVGEFMDWYYRDDAKHSNDTLEQLRKGTMDGRNHPFVAMKRTLRPWKKLAFVPNIQSGNSIYESAFGSGLNLLLTVEILREHEITNLTVYGNDYVAPSVAIANRVWKSTNIARHGNICVGDSSNLSFVPSNSFDFVFTGYIDPLVDALSLSKVNASDDDKQQVSIDNCISNDTDKQELARKEQEAQEKWYASWVSEMIRIVKPGKAVVVENTCESLCKIQAKKLDDWGGVNKEWWSDAIATYGWNVDPSSLIIEDEKLSKDWRHPRYHVLMRKKKVATCLLKHNGNIL